MNVKLLRKIQKHILAEPKRYEQNTVIRLGEPGQLTGSGYVVPRKFPECGTVACIGGWAHILSAKKPLDENDIDLDVAQKALRIDINQASRLFSYVRDRFDLGRGWPKKYATAYIKARTVKMRARIAARRIDHFIKTKGAE